MLSVEERIQGMVDILLTSNAELDAIRTDKTGFIAVPPQLLQATILKLLETEAITDISLDMGCGNGGWMLLAAAAGFPSYGIELDPVLIDHARRNYDAGVAAGFIAVTTPCAFVVGDMIPIRYSAAYMAFRKIHEDQHRSMPIGAVLEDSYSRLPTSVATADIVYCWAWPTQSRFLFNMLQDETKEEVLFILPSYEKYIAREHYGGHIENRLLLTSISNVQSVYVGRRKK